MSTQTINPTRMELTRLKKKLTTAMRGHRLLKDKRDELMRIFLELVRRNKALRESVEAGISSVNRELQLARAVSSDSEISSAFLCPKTHIEVEISQKNIMSVSVPSFSFVSSTSEDSDKYCYGFAFTPAELDGAVASLQKVRADMLELAEVEKSCLNLAAEIERTRRRVNALEHIVIPETEELIRTITMKLDENERSTQIRLMKVKDMMLARAHNYD